MQHSVATHPPTTHVQAFVADVEQLLDAHTYDADPDHLVRAVERRLTTLLASPGILESEDRIPWADHYRPHLLTVAPSRRFSLLALIWAPGQVTPIHDHICWCVVGVLEGREREQRFSLRQNSDGQRWLATTTDVMVMPGEVSRLTPPDENIHQVRNAGTELAISLHVYGADISVCGSSVNQCFDELPIREDAATPHAAVSWRGS
ncbi:MAG TPA: cysteine dioxygenase family protein [Ktedonobacterales bacterium]